MLALLTGAILVGGCHAEKVAPDVLLVVVDTLRPDFLGAYGFEYPTSPNFDALAAKGVVFERALAASGKTAPSHASIMTSRWVNEHSIGAINGTTRLDGEKTLAMYFKDSGYDTAAFIGNIVLRRRIGLDAGFDVYDDNLPDVERNRSDVFERTAPKTTARAVQWLSRRGDRPWFLWVHYQDPHGPYTPPASYSARFAGLASAKEDPLPVLASNLGRWGIPAYQVLDGLRRPGEYRSRYAGEIAFFDESLGKLLQSAHRPGRPLVIAVTADHGESMGEGGYFFGHGQTTTPDIARIPLLLNAPGLAPARRSELVSHVDILPTLLELAGLPVPVGARGLALGALIRAGSSIPERILYTDVGNDVAAYRGDHFERYWRVPGQKRAVGGSFIWHGGSRWEHGPGDLELRGALNAYVSSRRPVHFLKKKFDAVEIKRLRALGYVEPESK